MSKKQIKPEGNGEVRKETINPMRLASLFSSSRDLSLSNVKTNQRAQANKKNYAPNLNVTRNKNADKSNLTEGIRRGEKSDRGRSQRGRGGRNNTGNTFNKKGNLIQTVGFLSEGIAAAPLNRKTGEHYGGSSRESGPVEILQKPRIVKRDLKPEKADLDAEQKKLSVLLGEGGDELDLDDDDSKTSSSDDFLPIKIKDPNKRSIGVDSKKLNTEIKIKTEPVDDDVAMVNSDSPENSLLNGASTIKSEPGIELKSEEFHRMDKLFDNSPNEFMLFQMPDSLPGRAPDAMDTQNSDSASASKPQTPNLCSLEHLEEGLVGKLVRYKSGKTKLVLGDTVYDVDLGLTSDFQQNAVTINANTTERSANVYSLGPINGKYNITPDWLSLFHKMTP